MPSGPVDQLAVGRYLAGVAYGIIYISVITHIADNNGQNTRAKAIIDISLLTSNIPVIPLIWLIQNKDTSMSSISALNIYFGAIVIVLAVLGVFCAMIYSYESIPALINQGKENEAMETMLKLRGESSETWAVRKEFDEMKLMVIEDFTKCLREESIFQGGNLRPLLMIAALKLLNLLTINLPLYFLSIEIYFLPFVRILMLIGTQLLCERIGRKYLLLISGCLCGTAALAITITKTIIFAGYSFDLSTFWVLVISLSVLFMFAGSGIAPIQQVYAAEAFPLNKRFKSLTFVTCVEYIGHLVLIVWIFWLPAAALLDNLLVLFYITTVGIIVFMIWLYLSLPETRGMSLRQCRDEFNKNK